MGCSLSEKVIIKFSYMTIRTMRSYLQVFVWCHDWRNGPFDNKPRSASAAAITDVEITHISKADFNRIMKQIPKWFVNLMSTLSSRLRVTNDRLNEAESLLKSRANPLEELQLILNTYSLLWYKHASKTGKVWVIEPTAVKQELAEILVVNDYNQSSY